MAMIKMSSLRHGISPRAAAAGLRKVAQFSAADWTIPYTGDPARDSHAAKANDLTSAATTLPMTSFARGLASGASDMVDLVGHAVAGKVVGAGGAIGAAANGLKSLASGGKFMDGFRGSTPSLTYSLVRKPFSAASGALESASDAVGKYGDSRMKALEDAALEDIKNGRGSDSATMASALHHVNNAAEGAGTFAPWLALGPLGGVRGVVGGLSGGAAYGFGRGADKAVDFEFRRDVEDVRRRLGVGGVRDMWEHIDRDNPEWLTPERKEYMVDAIIRR